VETDLVPVRRHVATVANDLFGVIGIPFEQTTELQRQLLAVFAFGMAFAVGQFQKLTPPEVHALAIACLMDVFQYTDHQAVAFAEQLIAASTDRNVHPTIHDVVHRGIDGHYQWEKGQMDELRANIEGIFQAVGA
jgi:hypothetical protein